MKAHLHWMRQATKIGQLGRYGVDVPKINAALLGINGSGAIQSAAFVGNG